MNANNKAIQKETESKSTNKSTNTSKTEVMRKRSFAFVKPKTISLPVEGTFPATCFSVAMIGTYTSPFKNNNGDITYTDYERVGLGFVYVDKNTGEEQEVFTEVFLSDKEGSRLHSYALAMLQDNQDFNVENFVGASALVTIAHKDRTDKEGNKTGNKVANVDTVVSLPDGSEVGIDATAKHSYFDFNTDYSVDGTEKMKLLPKKHLWFIENRSNEYGKNPFKASANDVAQQPQQATQGQQSKVPTDGDKGNDVPF